MNQKERDKLILENLGLIYKCIQNFHSQYISDDEFETLYYYGILGLMRGIDSYDETKSAQSTYYYACIKNEMIQYIRSKELHKEKINHIHKYSIDSPIKEDSNLFLKDIIPSTEKFEHTIENNICVEKIIKFLEERYSKIDVVIFMLHFGLCGSLSMSEAEISELFNMSRKTISSKIVKMMQLLKRQKRNFM